MVKENKTKQVVSVDSSTNPKHVLNGKDTTSFKSTSTVNGSTISRERVNGEPDSDSGSGEETLSSSAVKNGFKRINQRNRHVSLHMKGSKTIYTAGRPPWYNNHGQMKEALLIGLCGGSASGKTTVAKKIIEELNVKWVSLLCMDSFYKVLNEEEHEKAAQSAYDFDHPDAFDFDLIVRTLKDLKKGKQVYVPVYNFTTHSRESNQRTVYGANVIIFEGILSFANKELLDIMDIKIFVDTDADIRLSRRLKRDINERGRCIESVLVQYNSFVKPSYENYIAPSMTHADLIVPRGGDNKIAINLIVNMVNRELSQRGSKNMRTELVSNGRHKRGEPLPKSFYKLEETKQLKYIQTVLRDRETRIDDFIFYSNRLMRLLIEYALSLLPFEEVTVKTTSDQDYIGKRHGNTRVCGVSILRAGECMEPALCEVYKNARIGKMLIQTNDRTREPELHYLRLPSDLSNDIVLLMDATLATGAAAMMAIRVLLDHSVKEENIVLLALIMSEQGVHNVAYTYPKVKIVTTAVDAELNDKCYILPGIGNFGNRYFGTE